MQPKAAPYLEYEVGGQKFAFRHVTGFEYLSTINGARTHSITVVTEHNEEIIRGLQREQKIVFRHGYAGGPLSAPVVHRLVDYAIAFGGNGISVTICGSDRSLFINRGVRCRCFNEMRISDMVATIAQEHKLQSEIEATDGKFTLRQIWVSDMQFIASELVPRAMSAATGRADYNIYVAGDTLHFHPPHYSNKVYRKHVFGQNKMPHLRELSVRFQGELANANGGLSARAHGYDPFAKQAITARVDNATTPEKELLGAKTFLLDLPYPAQAGRYFHRYQGENLAATTAEAKSAWYHAQRARYRARMVTDCDPGLEGGAVILLLIPTAQGYHLLSGRYLVEQVRHVIDARDHYSEIMMVRNGLLAGEDDLVGVKRTDIAEADNSGMVVKQSKNL